MFSGAGTLVGAAEQEQSLREIDRSGVDGVAAVVELVVAAVLIVAGDAKEGLGDRECGPQLVGGVCCEALLFGDVRVEPRQHGIEGVGELAEFVFAAW